MKLLYKTPRLPRIKGPLIYLDKGKSYRLDIGKVTELPAHVAHVLLEKYPECLEEVKEVTKLKKRAKPAPENKMLDEVPMDKDL